MIGEILNKARKNKHYTMSEVAAMVGVTTGYISNLEKNRLEPSLTLLRELSDKLGIPASSLIMDETIDYVTIIRSTERPRVKYGNLSCICEVLTPLNWHCTEKEEIDAIQIIAPPDYILSLDCVSGDTDICVYVLSGEITYHYGGNSIPVRQDGSLFIPRNSGYRIENTSKSDTVMIWLTKTLTSVYFDETDEVKETGYQNPVNKNIQLKLLGERIRDLRKTLGFCLKSLAADVGVTPTYLSQIERNITDPSLRVLRKIAKVLNVELTLLFASDMPSDILVTEPGTRHSFKLPDANTRFQLMMPYHTADERSPDMSVVLVDLGAGQTDSEDSIVHDYDEFCLVLNGGVEYHTPEGIYCINEGDSLYLRKGVQHTITNPYHCDAKLLAVLSSAFRRKLH